MTDNLQSIPSTRGDQRPLNVLVNGRSLSTVFTGVARYTRSLYQALDKLNVVEVSYFCGGNVRPDMPQQSKNLTSGYFPKWVKSIARDVRLSVEDHRLHSHLKHGIYDVYHETGLFPVTVSTAAPKVLTIYDLSLIFFKQYHPIDRVKHFERHFYDRLSTLDHIITLSQFGRKQVIDHLGVGPDKVTAIPLAASDSFFKRPENKIQAFLRTRNCPDQYILTVGTLEPRKNLLGLIRAYAQVETDLPLILVGWSGWMSEGLNDEISRLNLVGKVMLLGHVSDEELALLYSGARAMVFPSFYEGFGLPILEAMACGCPVVSSNSSSMPEVAGDAAILINPNDEKEIGEAISNLIDNDTLREDYIKQGYQQARRYSWQRTAESTLAVFQNVANEFQE